MASFIENADAVLNKACEEALRGKRNPSSTQRKAIDAVLSSSALTYKYILFTALLAKATDDSVNPLCLQKKSKLAGAYDARSLCHSVIVPFENDILGKALGGSNEPFLNKPARFPELSPKNAVRNGENRTILNILCKSLPRMKDSKDAHKGLVYLLRQLIRIRDEKLRMVDFSLKVSDQIPTKLMRYFELALNESHGGEVLTLIVAGVYHLQYRDESFIVKVHPVNESGASKREISDLDIYRDGKPLIANELKDKAFGETDVRHAVDKAKENGVGTLLFITGPRGKMEGDFAESIEEEYLEKGMLLQILTYRQFLVPKIIALNASDIHELMRFIIVTAQNTKFKDDVIDYLYAIAHNELGLEEISHECDSR